MGFVSHHDGSSKWIDTRKKKETVPIRRGSACCVPLIRRQKFPLKPSLIHVYGKLATHLINEPHWCMPADVCILCTHIGQSLIMHLPYLYRQQGISIARAAELIALLLPFVSRHKRPFCNLAFFFLVPRSPLYIKHHYSV